MITLAVDFDSGLLYATLFYSPLFSTLLSTLLSTLRYSTLYSLLSTLYSTFSLQFEQTELIGFVNPTAAAAPAARSGKVQQRQ